MRKIYTTLIFTLLASLSLFADQIVAPNAPSYEEGEFVITNGPQTAYVVADADAIDMIATLYYNGNPLEENAVIATDTNNNDLLLDASWELTPFSIRVTGSQLDNFNLGIELEVGFFQLLDEFGNIAQGINSYIIDSQAMKIVNITNLAGVTFNNSPPGSNTYIYGIPLLEGNYYSSTSMADFKLTWDAKSIPHPGNYISNIQVTFSVE
jgi:hypothetical protein